MTIRDQSSTNRDVNGPLLPTSFSLHRLPVPQTTKHDKRWCCHRMNYLMNSFSINNCEWHQRIDGKSHSKESPPHPHPPPILLHRLLHFTCPPFPHICRRTQFSCERYGD